MNDAEIFQLCRQGRPEGFRALYEQHGRFVFNLALRMLNDRHLAEDVLQETFAAAARAIGEFRGDSRLKTWLYSIGFHAALKVQEKRKREVISAEISVPGASDSESAVARRLDVRDVLDRLPSRDRALLIMAYWDDLTCREIGEVMGLTENHVKVLLFRARGRFQQIWPENAMEGGL